MGRSTSSPPLFLSVAFEVHFLASLLDASFAKRLDRVFSSVSNKSFIPITSVAPLCCVRDVHHCRVSFTSSATTLVVSPHESLSCTAPPSIQLVVDVDFFVGSFVLSDFSRILAGCGC
ncbi:uncharacterized protein G2W53_000905 [Senna tora]|uniref:Secreted protein n=1 Tax=Senna tora TaxID=362788 RepID=A0A834XEK2_9FABA|nr:uncharacterized protein G2W53_000905 [Senna tora]